MKLKTLIGLAATVAVFKHTEKRNYDNVSAKSFINEHERLNIAKQFKPVWEKSKEFLKIIASSNSKKEKTQATSFAENILFKEDLSNDNNLDKNLTNTTRKSPSLKNKQ